MILVGQQELTLVLLDNLLDFFVELSDQTHQFVVGVQDHYEVFGLVLSVEGLARLCLLFSFLALHRIILIYYQN